LETGQSLQALSLVLPNLFHITRPVIDTATRNSSMLIHKPLNSVSVSSSSVLILPYPARLLQASFDLPRKIRNRKEALLAG